MMSHKAYACYNKNQKILQSSSSGGVFYAIASTIVNHYGGIVYGCVIEKGNVFHKRAETLEGLLPMLGSKYVRSNLKNTYQECKQDLENDKWVLYSGTPCQINALYFYLDRFNVSTNKLIGLDIICHGTPKQFYWKKYLELNFKDENIDPTLFRYKKEGWKDFYIKIGEYEKRLSEDPFGNAFLKNKILCESCHNCHSKGENRRSDITLGDFWGIEQVHPKIMNKNGTSLVILRNKMDFLFNILRDNCFVCEVPFVSSVYPYNIPYFISVTKSNEPFCNEDLSINVGTNRSDESSVITKKKFRSYFSSLYHKWSHYPYCVYNNNKPRKHNNKVAIITDFGYTNYGNRLQNYALITLIRKMGKKPINVRFESFHSTFVDKIYTKLFLVNRNDKIPFKKSIHKASQKYEGKVFNYTKTLKREKKLCSFETVLVGSDQIWNASYHRYGHDLEYSLGNFGIINRPFKLVSYGASICLGSFDEEQSFYFSESLKNFDKISVRENYSKKTLESININNVSVVLDPALLLNADEWNATIDKYSRVVIPHRGYVFSYLLNFDEHYSHGDNFETINIMEKNCPYYESNQFDFIKLLKNADIVVTNSFHGLVFSVIFRKKVFLMSRSRQGMESRIEELLEFFQLKTEYNTYYDFSKMDFSLLNKRIEESRLYLLSLIN